MKKSVRTGSTERHRGADWRANLIIGLAASWTVAIIAGFLAVV